MKHIVVSIFVLIASLWAGWSQAQCKEEAEKLLDLQNRIVTRSFERLPVGAWARFLHEVQHDHLQPAPRRGLGTLQ